MVLKDEIIGHQTEVGVGHGSVMTLDLSSCGIKQFWISDLLCLFPFR
jgi:hypothetical protein